MEVKEYTNMSLKDKPKKAVHRWKKALDFLNLNCNIRLVAPHQAPQGNMIHWQALF